MPNIWKTKNWFKDPATLQLGTVDATEVRSLLTGEVSITMPALLTGAVASASASVVGLTASHRVWVQPQAWIAADAGLYIAAAIGIAGGIQVTGGNARSGSVSATAQNFSYLAMRT
jgi:hypothetical protein